MIWVPPVQYPAEGAAAVFDCPLTSCRAALHAQSATLGRLQRRTQHSFASTCSIALVSSSDCTSQQVHVCAIWPGVALAAASWPRSRTCWPCLACSRHTSFARSGGLALLLCCCLFAPVHEPCDRESDCLYHICAREHRRPWAGQRYQCHGSAPRPPCCPFSLACVRRRVFMA